MGKDQLHLSPSAVGPGRKIVVLPLALLILLGSSGEIMSETIEEVLKEHTEQLMCVPGVVGTAIGTCTGSPCIKVYVREKSILVTGKIPPSIDGYPVEIEETGEFKAIEKKKK